MKKNLFLNLLVLCIIIIIFLYQPVMINITNQEINSETKEKLVRYSRDPLIEETKEINLEDISKDNRAEEVNKNDINLNNQNNYNFLKISGNIDEENIEYAKSEIELLPNSLIETFSKNGWNIFITTENINQKYFGGKYDNVMGVTITAKNEIYIQNRKKSIQNSIVHEFGHFLDCINDFPSLNEEFSEIYNEEASTFKSRISNSSCVRDEMEFFAHTFYYLIKDSSKCTPRAAEYVQRYM